jgi:transposase
MKKNKNYTKEFKQQAVQLAEDLGVTKASQELGVANSNIYAWKTKLSGQSVVASRKEEIKPEELAKENQKLNQEVAQLKKVNHILKAAAAFFSQDHLK